MSSYYFGLKYNVVTLKKNIFKLVLNALQLHSKCVIGTGFFCASSRHNIPRHEHAINRCIDKIHSRNTHTTVVADAHRRRMRRYGNPIIRPSTLCYVRVNADRLTVKTQSGQIENRFEPICFKINLSTLYIIYYINSRKMRAFPTSTDLS